MTDDKTLEPVTIEPVTIEYLVWNRKSDRPCVRDDDAALTYSEFACRVDGFAYQLQQCGIGAGDVVAVMLPNRIELLVALVAAWRLRATATPINPAFTGGRGRLSDRGCRSRTRSRHGPRDAVGRPAADRCRRHGRGTTARMDRR